MYFFANLAILTVFVDIRSILWCSGIAADAQHAADAKLARESLATEFNDVLSGIAQDILQAANTLKSKSSVLYEQSQEGEIQARDVVSETRSSEDVLQSLAKSSDEMSVAVTVP